MSTTITLARTLALVLDQAPPGQVADALRSVKLGTLLAPLKRTFAGLVPATAFDLTALDASGETIGTSNPNRLAAFLMRTLRVTAAAVSHLLAGGADAVKASLDMATKTTHINTVIQAKVAGTAGNSFTITSTADGAGVGSLTLSGSDYTFHYATGVTTVANFETLITASANLEVKTPGTGATLIVAVVDAFSSTALAGGAAAVKAEFALAGIGSGALDTVVRAATAGAAGNAITIVVIGDSTTTATAVDTSNKTTLHYKPGTSTVANVETAIGTSTLIEVKTAGTGATVLTATETPGAGTYLVTDAAGATVSPAGHTIPGLALISDDGKTLTFPVTVDGFTTQYVPRMLSSTDLAAVFAPTA